MNLFNPRQISAAAGKSEQFFMWANKGRGIVGVTGVILGLGVVSVFAAEKAVQNSGTSADRTGTASTNATPAYDYPVIVYLERRGQTIAVKAGPKGPIYSAKTAEGKVLFENLSAEQLRARAPEVHDFIKTAMARNSDKSGPIMDARIRVMMR